jgi:hypothetical protein
VVQAKLHLGPSNWCSALQSFVHERALRPGERPVHGYRAGVVELVADVQVGEDYCGRWLGIEDVRAGDGWPCVGDLAVYNRSVAGRPETSWWRHVNRIESIHDDMFVAIGGNERHKIRRGSYHFSNPKLMGFILYPPARPDGSTRNPVTRPMLSDREREQIMDQVALSLDGIIKRSLHKR